MSDMDLDKLERDLAEAELVADPMDMANKEAALLDQMPALIAELRRLRGQVKDLEAACLQSARMARSLEKRIEQRAHEPKETT